MPRREKKKFYFIYKTTCKINGKFYIGMHSTNNLNDGYLGSGKRLRYSVNKYGDENHIFEKLEFLNDREELKKRESEIINSQILDDPLCMNLIPGGGGGFINEEHKRKFLAAGGKKVFQILSKRHFSKLETDQEYKKKYSETLSRVRTGKRNGFYGKTHSDEFIQKMKNLDRTGSKNSQFGSRWITNEKKNKKLHPGNIIPDGWRLGRI